MSEIGRYNSVKGRPLEAALAIRSGFPVVNWRGELVLMTEQDRMQMFRAAVPVLLDQVSDWWDSVGCHKWPDDRLEPMGRLPWPVAWIEWRESTWHDAQYGGVIRAARLQEIHTKQFLGVSEKSLPEVMRRVRRWAAPLTAAGADLIILANSYSRYDFGTNIVAWPAHMWGAYSKTGEALSYPGKGWLFSAAAAEWREFNQGKEDPEVTMEGGLAVWRLFTALLGVRGTIVSDTPMPRHTRKQFRRIADGEPPWVHYKTLSVDLHLPDDVPTYKPKGEADGPLKGVPLHMVRGHIADYRRGAGLFGKYRGLVWRPMHHRGYQRLGVVAKQYEAVVSASHPEGEGPRNE